LVGAIAAGNCVVIKPGSYAVASSHALARVITKYFDQNCIRAIEGNRDITQALLDQSFETIFFTGSAFVGKMVAEAAAKNLRPCVLELGGKSPTIIDRSANLVHAAQRLIWGTFVNGGQTCVRPDFCCVHDEVANQFFALCQKYIKEFYGQNPQQTEWFGRCINDGAYKRLKGLLDQSRDRIVCGGRTDPSDRFIEPTIFDFGRDIEGFKQSPIMQDEIFGPLLPCVRFTDLESVIRLIRDLPTGKPLALYCFATNANVIEQIKTRTTSGGLVINDCLMHLANHELPFGGVGNSGMGSYHGIRSFNAFTHEKAVLEKVPWIDESFLMKPLLAARFPPYTPIKASLVKLFSLHWVGNAVNYPMPFFRFGFKLFFGLFLFHSLGFRVVLDQEAAAASPLVTGVSNFLHQLLGK
jgi:aldehyde dehydrogenase (NAD+)